MKSWLLGMLAAGSLLAQTPAERRSHRGIDRASAAAAAAQPPATAAPRARAKIGPLAAVSTFHGWPRRHARARFRQGTLLPGGGRCRCRPGGYRVGHRTGRRPAPTGAGLRLVPGSPQRSAEARTRDAPEERHRRHRMRTTRWPRRMPVPWQRSRSSTTWSRFRAPELEHVVRGWWIRKIAPELAAGRSVVSRDDAYPLYELLHVLRDNTSTDLREASSALFSPLPHRTSGELLPRPHGSAGERFLYRRRPAHRRARSARRGPFPRRRTRHGRLRPERAPTPNCYKAG